MPLKIDDVATSLQIVAEFPEIKKHYGGHGTAVNMSITATPASGRFLSFDEKEGIVVGKQDDFYLTMQIFCSNPEQNIPSEHCLTFDIKTNFWLNVTVQDFDFYLMIKDAVLEKVEITKDAIGMKDREYARVLQHILNYGVAGFNYFQQQNPLNTTSLFEMEPLLREFVNLKGSPFVQNEFYVFTFDAKTQSEVSPLNHTNSLASHFEASASSLVSELIKRSQVLRLAKQ